VGPNPSAGPVRFTWEPGRPGAVRLRIYDAGGRLVEAMAGGPGSRALTWDARVPGGVYFYELEAGGARAAGKVERLR
jgi:hypothetical protein